MTPPPIRLHEVTLCHGGLTAVRGVSGVFAPGSLTALIGPNGAGKSTLLRAIARLHPLAGGSIDRGGLRPMEIALLPQGAHLDRSFPISCRDVVALGLLGQVGAFRAMPQERLRAAERALAAVGLPDHAGRPVGALSAGQFQRVLFARLIVQDASVLLLDEPFAAVDAGTTEDLLAILRFWHAEGRTIITVLHDLDLVHDAFPRALLLDGGVVAWGPTAAALTEGNRQRAGLPRQGWALARQHAD
jgi:zinc/manganese transport system ATP-binding protein